jgi:hypothetical protein
MRILTPECPFSDFLTLLLMVGTKDKYLLVFHKILVNVLAVPEPAVLVRLGLERGVVLDFLPVGEQQASPSPVYYGEG